MPAYLFCSLNCLTLFFNHYFLLAFTIVTLHSLFWCHLPHHWGLSLGSSPDSYGPCRLRMALKCSLFCHLSWGITTSFNRMTGCLQGISCIICGVSVVLETVFLVYSSLHLSRSTFQGWTDKLLSHLLCREDSCYPAYVITVSSNSIEPQSAECSYKTVSQVKHPDYPGGQDGSSCLHLQETCLQNCAHHTLHSSSLRL